MYELEFMFIPNGFDNIFGGSQQTFTLLSIVSPQKNNETLFQSLCVDIIRNTLESFTEVQYTIYMLIMHEVIVPFS